jgi:hypothetical protein
MPTRSCACRSLTYRHAAASRGRSRPAPALNQQHASLPHELCSSAIPLRPLCDTRSTLKANRVGEAGPIASGHGSALIGFRRCGRVGFRLGLGRELGMQHDDNRPCHCLSNRYRNRPQDDAAVGPRTRRGCAGGLLPVLRRQSKIRTSPEQGGIARTRSIDSIVAEAARSLGEKAYAVRVAPACCRQQGGGFAGHCQLLHRGHQDRER